MNPAPFNEADSHPPLNCETAMTELWDYLDSELADERLQQIRQHLATCTGCAAHVEFCRAFLAQIQTAPVPTEDVDALRSRVQQALRQSV